MVIVITGIMAAGKSTVAQIIAERLPRSAHVRGDVFRRMIRTRPCHVVVLAPRMEVVEAREAGRLKTGYGAWTVASLYAALEATPRMGLWLDNSDQSPAATADAILAAI